MIQLIGITKEELISEIVCQLTQALTNDFAAAEKSVKGEKEFFTRDETAKMLNVSYATLHNWSKEGNLTPQKIGHRVYYSKNEVYSKLQIIS